jgi:hypothetical protein
MRWKCCAWAFRVSSCAGVAREALRRKLLQQRVQVQARAFLAQQRLVHQRSQHRQRGAGHRARRLHREAAVEDRKARKRVALPCVQELPRSLEHHFEARVAGRTRAVRGMQHEHAFVELLGDLGARHHPSPRGGQLDRER